MGGVSQDVLERSEADPTENYRLIVSDWTAAGGTKIEAKRGGAVTVSAEQAAAMAFLSWAAYEQRYLTPLLSPSPGSYVALSADENLANSGWTALTAQTLGLPSSSFKNGFFESGHTQALVAIKNGTIALAIRGSDEVPSDFQDALNNQFIRFQQISPLVDALNLFISNPANAVHAFFITGHSLGGAIAQAIAQLYDFTIPSNIDISIATFGSPGTPWAISTDLARTIVNFGQSQDPIFTHDLAIGGDSDIKQWLVTRFLTLESPADVTAALGQLHKVGDSAVGLDGQVVVDVPDADARVAGEHSVVLYARSIESLWSSSFGNAYLANAFNRSLIVDTLLNPGEDRALLDLSSRSDDLLIIGESGLFRDYPTFLDEDIIYGGLGNDWIDGGRGTDWLHGGLGSDVIVGGAGADHLFGDAQDDALDGGAGSDTIDGGAGVDTVRIGIHGNVPWFVDLSNGKATALVAGESDTLLRVENISAGAGNDTIYGDIGDNVLNGGAGNDSLDGGGGFDTAVFSGKASDYHITRSGLKTTVTGLDGMDTLVNIEYLKFGNSAPVPNFDPPPPAVSLPSLSISDRLVTEGASGTSLARFTVALSGTPTVPVTVSYTTIDGTAVAGSDYITKTGTLTFFPNGPLEQTVDIAIIGDTTPEATQSFSVVLSQPSNAVISDGSGIGTIFDNPAPAPPPPGVPVASISDAQIVEGNAGTSYLAFSISLSAVPTSRVTVDWSTSDGTATTADGDYTAAHGTAVFQPGQTWPWTAVVPIIGDAKVEGDEALTVTLANPVGASLGQTTATGTIRSDDAAPLPLPTISISNAGSVTEGNPGDAHNFLDFLVSLSAPAAAPVTVNWFTSDGTATYAGLNGDYEARSDLLQFNIGEQFKHIQVEVDTDRVVEGAETLNVSLWGANGANIGTAAATGTIADDDTFSISISDASVLEGNDGTANAEFYVTLTNPSQRAVTVHYSTSAGTATTDQDFLSANSILTFNPGQTRASIVVPLVGDTDVEGTETFAVSLTAPSDGTFTDSTALGTIITDDSAAMWNFLTGQKVATSTDPAGSLSLDGRYVAFSKVVQNQFNGWANIYVLDKQTNATSQVTFGISGNSLNPSISADGRFVAYESSDPVLLAGDTNAKTDIFVTDRLNGTTERISLSSAGVQGDGNSTNASISADGRYVAFVSDADNLVAGDINGHADIFVYDRISRLIERVNVAADGTQANADSTVPVISADGSTIAFNSLASNLVAQDHNAQWDTYVFDRSSQTLQVVSVDSSGNGGFGNPGLGFHPGLSADGRLVGFNTDWGISPGDNNSRWDTYVFDRTLSSYMRVSVGPNGQQGDQDTFGDIQMSPDGSQVTFLDFSTNLFPNHNPSQADVVVATRQVAPTISVSSVAMLEGQTGTPNAQFTVTLSRSTVQPVTVNYFTEDGTAVAGSDYLARNGQLVFAPGELTKTVTVPILSDLTFEDSETFALRLFNASNAVLGNEGIATILNDDAGPPKVSVSDATVNEGNGGSTPATFTLSLSGAWGTAVAVNYATTDGSAASASDYQSSIGSVVFAPGETHKTISVSVTGDSEAEGNETLLLNLTGATNALVDRAVGIGTILNDDSAGGLTFRTTERLDVGSDGHQSTGQQGAYGSAISADGRYASFYSWDNGLITGDTNFRNDAFVYDRQTDILEKISNGLNGAQSNGDSIAPVLSANGRYAAFWSGASNLVAGDTSTIDVFVYDRQAHTTERISVSNGGVGGNESSLDPAISSDGRYVAFRSVASNFAAGDNNNTGDIFVRDRQLGTTEIISVNSSGVVGNASSYVPSISGDGRYVTFVSLASNLVSGDTNGAYDIGLLP